MIIISPFEYIVYPNALINIYWIKTYPYKDTLQTNKMPYQLLLNNDYLDHLGKEFFVDNLLR